jgi:hypothetical protein
VARGWESKSVENQIEESRERVRASEAGKAPDERETRRTSLHLARARALQDLQVACDRRHRALLEQTVAHLDTEIEKLSK